MTDPIEPRVTGASAQAGAIGDVYDALVAKARAGTRRFERSFQTHLHTAGEDWISLTELDDDFHAMRIALRVATDGTVLEAAGRMLRHPFDTCPRALEFLAGLVGANVFARGTQGQLRDRIPRRDGCLHLADMLTVAFRSFRIARGHDLPGSDEQLRRQIIQLMPTVRDSCVSFSVE